GPGTPTTSAWPRSATSLAAACSWRASTGLVAPPRGRTMSPRKGRSPPKGVARHPPSAPGTDDCPSPCPTRTTHWSGSLERESSSMSQARRRSLVVAGTGMAGAKLVEEVLARDPERFSIRMFGAEPHGTYNRILLSSFLGGFAKPEQLWLNSLDWYE